MTDVPSRRMVLGGAAVIGAGVVLSACGSNEEPDASTGATEPAVAPGSSAAQAADVPVGSGIIVASAKAVITQPTAGEYKAFNYTCTHKGCPVSKISGDTISCTCHGSQFSTTDGSVKKGPATNPLAELPVKEEGGELFLG